MRCDRCGMDVPTRLKAGQLWEHRKTQGRYIIVALAKIEATQQDVVVYSGESGAWVRPLDEFMERFDPVPPGAEDPRLVHVRHYRQTTGSGLSEALNAVNAGYRAPR